MALDANERALLMACTHGVARCAPCRLVHGFFELMDDRLCARCQCDLISEVRCHLWQCPEIAVRRARRAVDKSEALGKSSRQLRDIAGVTRAESEATRTSTQTAQRPAAGCPHCEQPIEPGQGVSFQHGELIH